MKTSLSCVLAGTILATGCSSIVVRENVLASVNTTVGASVTENAQTQLYEARAGYIRHQFYSIPTGKRVEGTNQAVRPRAVPQVLSGIRVESGVKQLWLGSDISENFATGPLGVLSPAAVAMYVSESRTAEYASSAMRGVNISTHSFKNDPASRCLSQYWRPGGAVNADHAARLRAWLDANGASGVDLPDFINLPQFVAKRRMAVGALGIECD